MSPDTHKGGGWKRGRVTRPRAHGAQAQCCPRHWGPGVVGGQCSAPAPSTPGPEGETDRSPQRGGGGSPSLLHILPPRLPPHRMTLKSPAKEGPSRIPEKRFKLPLCVLEPPPQGPMLFTAVRSCLALPSRSARKCRGGCALRIKTNKTSQYDDTRGPGNTAMFQPQQPREAATDNE